jgi:hypothetical protein
MTSLVIWALVVCDIAKLQPLGALSEVLVGVDGVFVVAEGSEREECVVEDSR